MTEMVRQTMFTTGEVDITTWKRTDVNEYLTAAQSLKNAVVGTTGLAKKRMGSTKALNVNGYAQLTSRTFEFVDKNNDHYLVLASGGYFHIFDAPTDQHFVITNTAYVVTSRGANVVTMATSFHFVQSVVNPYSASAIPELDYTEDNDSIIFTHPDYSPRRLYISDYNTLTFSFEELDIYPYPAYDFGNINYNSFTVNLSVTGDTLTFQFTGLGSNPGFNNDWIGGEIIGGGATDIDPVGYAIITAVSYSGGTTTFTATVQIPFKTSGFATQGSQYSVRQPMWSATLGYPAKVLYYQNRLWLGNTKTLPETIAGSKINQPTNFDVGTGKDTDAIVYTLGVTGSGGIQWMNGGKQLEIMCANLEFACPQDQNSALTPSTFTVRQQTSFGASPQLKPITYINDTYFASKTGKAFINYHFQGVGLAYTSSNISAASSHLVKNPTNRALIRGSDTSQDNFIYFINQSDNTLTAFQFAQEYKLAALTPVEFQDDVMLIDIVSIDNVLYILKYYSLSDNFIIEQFNDNYRIDSARTAAMASDGTITGLDELEGYTVQVVYEDQDFGEYQVVDGEITVYNPMEIADNVQVGLLYDVEIKPMYIFAGSANAPFMKNFNRIYVDYYNSLDFYINGKLVPYQNFADIQAGLPLVPQTDTAIVAPVSGWNRFSTFSITQSSPFDLQILSIGYQVDSAVI